MCELMGGGGGRGAVPDSKFSRSQEEHLGMPELMGRSASHQHPAPQLPTLGQFNLTEQSSWKRLEQRKSWHAEEAFSLSSLKRYINWDN